MIRTILLAAAAAVSCGTASASSLQPGGRYVSMGSSYAAGPGVGSPDPASGACARSQSNFARQVAARHQLDLVDVSCSGATTRNILSHGQHGFPAQIEAVTPDTRVVTVLIGGNDVAYVGNLLGLSCRDTGGADCKVVPDGEVDRKLAALPSELQEVVDQVRHRAPKAAVVLIGYLPAIPTSGVGTCPDLPLGPDDAARMREVAVRLAQAIGGAAARTGVGIVRSSMIGAGHDACAEHPYVAGYRPPRNPGWRAPVPYHPTQAGMDRIAADIEAALARR
ncbi:lysophospholipase L1-like esterase [Methylobacterium sp. PvP062]|uniref:Lysophospholipase L1-like esterase n=1 Tax=Methylobacterium radiotolerans TaxID=31998 RepID=A0ABV2NKV4_9HYPH|nr:MULTISPECIES: SGNH/GDSL hydrolase family protein [unclassified Methylobacterium]MBP2496136.1 lysophospholipase L1-like esterase [Methylobacterium sp. PvP105]MBP2503992.1 lysophospholipase L1-like esterase [Methylobacterium sp. PvP109]MCX7335539.1 SGNH/GDSL hydrolase family protein [Hyphomicrobiales bacterium]